jgi:SAM-dependent methyltransferase
VTGVTLSREQLQWGMQRITQAGLQAQVDLRYQDYRDLVAEYAAQPFDAIVSIEMFEAVGHEYWRTYFQVLRDCLKPGGYACLQSITLREDLFARYLHSTDFIQQFIFPGGLLPSVTAFEQEAQRAGLTVEKKMRFGKDYAETLRRWRHAFEQRLDEVRSLASMSALCAFGGFTWPIAKRPLIRATPMWSSSLCAGLTMHDIRRRQALVWSASLLAPTMTLMTHNLLAATPAALRSCAPPCPRRA